MAQRHYFQFFHRYIWRSINIPRTTFGTYNPQFQQTVAEYIGVGYKHVRSPKSPTS
jgi:hypothetical protein